MALFTLTDIKFKKEDLTRSFSGAPGTDIFNIYGQNRTYQSWRYPIDIGTNLDKGHYIIFHINEQVRTQFSDNSAVSELPTILETRKILQTRGLRPTNIFDALSKASSFLIGVIGEENDEKNFDSSLTDRLSNFSGLSETESSLLINQISNVLSSKNRNEAFNFLQQLKTSSGLRTIKRTKDSIVLYMPDTLAFSQAQSYSPVQLGGGGLAAAGAIFDIGKSLVNDFKSDQSLTKTITNAISNLSPFLAARVAQQFGDTGLAVFSAATGTVLNPQIELLYTSPQLRTFRFEFMLYPRSEKEAQQVIGIIERFRFHQAPELLTDKQNPGSYFMVPPSEFDIKFYYAGTENVNIPKISTCVLTSLDVDYAPNGFSAYEVIRPGNSPANVSKGGTGMPTSIRLSLDFMETEILTKESIRYYSEPTATGKYRP